MLRINNLYYPEREILWILYVQNEWVKGSSEKVYDDESLWSACKRASKNNMEKNTQWLNKSKGYLLSS